MTLGDGRPCLWYPLIMIIIVIRARTENDPEVENGVPKIIWQHQIWRSNLMIIIIIIVKPAHVYT